jgi:hypothetical protein
MKRKTAFKTIEDYLFSENKRFIIPNYQRGYKWAVKENEKTLSAVEKLVNDLLAAPKEQSYFLQGVTVVENENDIVLIDGQQRTTTLYLLLRCLDIKLVEGIILDYDIRQQSKEFITNLRNKDFDYERFDKENRNQDVYFFKQAIKQINSKIKHLQTKGTEVKEFIEFLLKKVTILYIVIESEKATRTFTMMNGSKASMLQEELIKADLLHNISLPESKSKTVSTSIEDNLNDLKEIIASDWETNALRSRYAREWDKWLYWWNREDIKDYFGVGNPMGLLLNYYFTNKENQIGNFDNKRLSYENFKSLFKKENRNATKLVFKELRNLQKSFEDIYTNPRIYNSLKMSIICSSNNTDKYDIINYFIVNKNDLNLLEEYAKWRLVGATHRQIAKEKELKDDESRKEGKANDALKRLSEEFVYQNAYELALKQLLRLNVEEDNKLFGGKGRAFDFSIYSEKSLEHIHPKSKAFHKKEITEENDNNLVSYYDGNEKDLGISAPEGEQWLNRDELCASCSEHSIGNLVLLDKSENSKFNDRSFEEKKYIYFNVNEGFKSRNLLHTISVFSKSHWSGNDIEQNQQEFLTRFKKDYRI